jgi:hypothetical protein
LPLRQKRNFFFVLVFSPMLYFEEEEAQLVTDCEVECCGMIVWSLDFGVWLLFRVSTIYSDGTLVNLCVTTVTLRSSLVLECLSWMHCCWSSNICVVLNSNINVIAKLVLCMSRGNYNLNSLRGFWYLVSCDFNFPCCYGFDIGVRMSTSRNP